MKDSHPYIVGIGASAGGLDAIKHLFDNIPENTGKVFIIVQHLAPDFKSLMPELLAKHTKMKIYTARNNQLVKPNCIYLNQKNKNIYLKGDRLHLIEKDPKSHPNLPIDMFFETLGKEHGNTSMGVILSGTGTDGSRGIKVIKKHGGILAVQDPKSAQFDGMPNTSIATDLVDYILPPKQIAEIIVNTPNHKILLSNKEKEQEASEVVYYQILNLIRENFSIDFKHYKKNTLLRRMEKHMNVNNFVELKDYYIFFKKQSK